MTCRMYKKKPPRERDMCALCAVRGGWDLCRRSKAPELARKAEDFRRRASEGM